MEKISRYYLFLSLEFSKIFRIYIRILALCHNCPLLVQSTTVSDYTWSEVASLNALKRFRTVIKLKGRLGTLDALGRNRDARGTVFKRTLTVTAQSCYLHRKKLFEFENDPSPCTKSGSFFSASGSWARNCLKNCSRNTISYQ